MSVQFKDYYVTLGVARDADRDTIKKAFRKLARKYHPDVAADKSTAEEKFKEINEAFEVLGDSEKRGKYDRLGASWRDPEGTPPGATGHRDGDSGQEFHFGGTGFSDFFEQYFSGGSRYGFPTDAGTARDHNGMPRPSGARRGADIEGDILVTLDEVMHGTLRTITMQMADHGNPQPATRSFQVRIPPGATDGRRIRVAGHGEPGHGGAPPGDLYLRVRHAAHPDFSSHQADLYHDLDVAPWEAVLGAEIAMRLCPRLGLDEVEAVELVVDADGLLTGAMIGPNCRGPEKVVRLDGWLAGAGLDRSSIELWAYGDSTGDDELLAAADHAHRCGRPPRKSGDRRGVRITG